jgi:hypothetical protein
MRALSAGELLGVWERGLAQGLAERALTLLAAACDVRPDELVGLTIGQRDACLLTLRELACPGCGQRLELTFDVTEVRADEPAEPGRAAWVTKERYQVQCRPPNSSDLAAGARESDPRELRKMLLARCLIAAHLDGGPVAVDQLPSDVLDAVGEAIAEVDPQADVQLAVSCASCGRPWRTVFDIVSFFWEEIDAWACRILREIHILASAYQWTERDILALTPQRRQLYLDMVSG